MRDVTFAEVQRLTGSDLPADPRSDAAPPARPRLRRQQTDDPQVGQGPEIG